MQVKVCKSCHEEKPIEKFLYSKGYRLNTCRTCESEKRKARRKYKTVVCVDCNIELNRRTDQIVEKNRCKACASIKRGVESRGRILEKARLGDYVPCKQCGKTHYKTLSHLKRGYNNWFCSSDCQGRYQAENFDNPNFIKSADNRGEKNGRYKHGNRVGGHVRHKELRLAVKNRDGEGCYICRTTERLHLHRIIPGALDGRYELENCVFLCRKHHSEVHKDYHKWKPILLQTAKKVNQ